MGFHCTRQPYKTSLDQTSAPAAHEACQAQDLHCVSPQGCRTLHLVGQSQHMSARNAGEANKMQTCSMAVQVLSCEGALCAKSGEPSSVHCSTDVLTQHAPGAGMQP